MYRNVLRERPGDFDALHLLGVLLLQTHRPGPGIESIEKAIGVNGASAIVHFNHANGLRSLNRLADAVASYDKAIALEPGYADAHGNRGNALLAMNRAEAAVASYDKTIALRPGDATGYFNRGNALTMLRRAMDAIASYDKAIALRPDYADAHVNRGTTLVELLRPADALASYDRAIAINPGHAEAFNSRGAALTDLGRLDEAAASYRKAIELNPDHRSALSGAWDVAQKMCDWPRAAELAATVRANVEEKSWHAVPFAMLCGTGDARLHALCAQRYMKEKIPVPPQPLWTGPARDRGKIRIAYLSADFHAHATAFLTAGLFEFHDSAKFETIGLSYGARTHGPMRERLTRAFDRFHDVRAMGDLEVARFLRAQEVDIAIDLKGHTRDARPEILAHRPAPIQVSYLGYPGTMGADFIDYILADPVVLPFDQQPCYTEKIVHLPECYQVNDASRKIGERAPSRREAGLPDRGFVFCCFNNNLKIAAPVFDVWMRLLRDVEDSVLWLLCDHALAERNLRREAAARGVDPARLVFANWLPPEDHLARHRLADLFLDTLPYNAHTTASDALWAGLPVLTCRGETFAGRVAASLLAAIGLPELATDNLTDYERLATRLATDAVLLGRLRETLARNRTTHPLFDTDRFRRHIEAAYTTMWTLSRQGEPPRSFRVEAAAA